MNKSIWKELLLIVASTMKLALYQFFKHKIDKYLTHPSGPPVVVENKLVDMFTHCTHSSVIDKILALFLRVSPLRVVIASIDFGMGFDCHDVRQTIHWGVSEDVEMYIRESGLAGHDGLLSCCVLWRGLGQQENFVRYDSILH